MPETEWYNWWFASRFYQELHADVLGNEMEDFINRVVSEWGVSPGSRLLEVSCGTGENSRVLAKMNVQVTGTDLSPANVELANRTTPGNLDFYVHDMRLPFWGNYFDYAFIFSNRFGFFRTMRENESAIRTISNALKPGGIFILDYLNAQEPGKRVMPEENKTCQGTAFQIRNRQDDTHFYREIKILPQGEGETHAVVEKYFKITVDEFAKIFARHGLEIRNVYGSYALVPFDPEKSHRMILVAEKKTGLSADREKRLYSDGRATDALT